MIRKFVSDRRGNYALMTVITMVPLMGAVALAVDYTELVRQRQETMNALDAAGMAAAQQIVAGASDADVKAYAKDFFEANLRHVEPVNTTLTVTLPNNNAGGGTLKLQAALKYHPYFLPAAAALLGRTANSTEVDFTASSEIRLKNTLEVALVLDNSGSMSTIGSGTGQEAHRTCSRRQRPQLVDTLALQAQQMKQIAKPVQFSLVPFSASVNVGVPISTARLPTWLDLDGISPIHHENFDWSTMYKTAPGADAEQVHRKGWRCLLEARQRLGRHGQNTKATRFSLYHMTSVRPEMVPTTTQDVCITNRNGTCDTGHGSPNLRMRLHDRPHTKPGRAAWRRGRIRTMTTIRRRPQARPPACSCRCSRRTRPAIYWRDSNRDGHNDVTVQRPMPGATVTTGGSTGLPTALTDRVARARRTCANTSWSSLTTRSCRGHR